MVKIFGKEITTREFDCIAENETGPIPIAKPFIYLFIQTSDICQANCPFCIYHNNIPKDFDVDKLGTILRELSNDDSYRVRKLNLTGGEPLLDLKLFDKICNCILNNFKFDDHYTGITLNTNGINLDKFLDYDCLFDFLALSRHHYLDDKNAQIFGTNTVPTTEQLLDFYEQLERKFIVILRCNLITGQIDSFEQIKKYLDYFLLHDFKKFSFVTLAPNNDFCKSHQVDFHTLIKENDDLLKIQQYTRIEENKYYCRCSNYAYTNETGKIATIYTRNFCNNYIKDSTLVYDGKYLRYGFGGEIIF